MLSLLAGCSSNVEEESLTATLSSSEREALKTLNNISTGMGSDSSSESSNKESNTLKSTDTTLSVNFSQIDSSIESFSYIDAEILGDEEGKKLYNFSQENSTNKVKSITAIDHNHEHENENNPVGVIWYQDISTNENFTEYSSIIASYLLLEDQTIAYDNNTLYIKDAAGNPISGISKLQFGTPDQQCSYSFSSASDQETETTETEGILFESCPIEIKAFDSTGIGHGFNGALDNVSFTLEESDLTDFDINNPDYIIKRPLYNQSAKQIGYFEINMITGTFSVVDNNHQAL